MIPVHQGIADVEKELRERNVVLYIRNIVSVDEQEQLKAIDELDKLRISGLCNHARGV